MSINSLSSRIKRLLTANVHSLVSSLENLTPQALLEQYLREFDEVIDQSRSELGKQEAAKHQASRALIRFNNELENLSEQIEIALASNQEEAARAGIAKQIELEEQIDALNNSLNDVIDRITSTENDVLNLKVKRKEMEETLKELIIAQKESGTDASFDNVHSSNKQKAEKLEDAFNRMMGKTSQLNGLISSGSDASPEQLRKLKEMQKEHRINERLARLKNTQNG